MTEFWINVYKFPGGKVVNGTECHARQLADRLAKTACANGAARLYVLHVRMKAPS